MKTRRRAAAGIAALAVATVFQPTAVNAIIAGAEADSTWGATLLLQTASGSCSATLVGPKVILTSARCIPDPDNSDHRADVQGAVTLQANDDSIQLRCERHPDYSKQRSADFALCSLEEPVLDIQPQRIDTQGALLKPQSATLLAGYGCQRPGGADRSFGKLTIGQATLIGEKLVGHGSLFITDGAAACYGDAGGGAYIAEEGADSERRLVGVISLSDNFRRTYFAETSNPSFVGWASEWSKSNDETICGLDESGCETVVNMSGHELPSDYVKTGHKPDSEAVIQTFDKGLTKTASTPGFDEDIGAREKISVSQGETILAAVDRACGFQPGDYYALLRSMHTDPESTVEAERSIEIPACSPGRPIERLARQAGRPTTPWELFDYVRDKDLRPRWIYFETSKNEEGFWNALQDVNPDVDLTQVPMRDVETIVVPLTPMPAPQATSSVATPPKTVQAIVGVDDEKGECPEEASAGYPFDLAALLDVLASNRAWVNEPDEVVVLIADSGLYGAGEGMFRSEVFAPLGLEEGQAEAIRPLKHDGPEPAHGTQVASLALGGPLFGRMNAAIKPHIKLVVKRIYKTYSVGGKEVVSTEVGAFSSVVDSARDHAANIINMSVKTDFDLSMVREELTRRSGFLFVVAAGNSDGDLENADYVYPARFGGHGAGQYNLLTVAALKSDGSLATFSNYNKEWVEIGAPGCAVPALSYDWSDRSWREVRLNGTSMAAPLVSFAAALVSSEKGLKKPMDIKRRLLVSADLDPTMRYKIEDGRKLNIVKAAALHQDVVETDDRLIFGDLRFIDRGGRTLEDHHRLPLQCDEGPGGSVFEVSVKDILKIWPRYSHGPAGSMARLYLRGDDHGTLFRTKDCILPDGYTVGIKDAGRGGADVPLEFDEIRDIVRKL